MKKNIINPLDLFDDFLTEGISNFTLDNPNQMGIVEFAEEIVFNGEEHLYPPQRAILKAFYGEPLSEDELFILYDWKGEDRTTWEEGRKYSNLVLEAGRGSIYSGPLAQK